MLPQELEESTFVSLSTLISQTVLNGLRRLSITTIPDNFDQVPLSTVAWVYDFFLKYELHTNHTLLASTINIGDLIGLDSVIEYLYDLLNEAHYQPYFFTNTLITSLQLQVTLIIIESYENLLIRQSNNNYIQTSLYRYQYIIDLNHGRPYLFRDIFVTPAPIPYLPIIPPQPIDDQLRAPADEVW